MLIHFHLTTIIQQLQYIRSIMLNRIQVHFTNKGSTRYISTTSTIYNQTTHLVLYMAMPMKDVLPLLINIIFLDLNLKCTSYNQGLTFNRVCNLLISIIFQWWHISQLDQLLLDSMSQLSLITIILLFGHSKV